MRKICTYFLVFYKKSADKITSIRSSFFHWIFANNKNFIFFVAISTLAAIAVRFNLWYYDIIGEKAFYINCMLLLCFALFAITVKLLLSSNLSSVQRFRAKIDNALRTPKRIRDNKTKQVEYDQYVLEQNNLVTLRKLQKFAGWVAFITYNLVFILNIDKGALFFPVILMAFWLFSFITISYAAWKTPPLPKFFKERSNLSVALLTKLGQTSYVPKRFMRLGAATVASKATPYVLPVTKVVVGAVTVGATLIGADMTMASIENRVPIISQVMDEESYGVYTVNTTTRNQISHMRDCGVSKEELLELADENHKLDSKKTNDRYKRFMAEESKTL